MANQGGRCVADWAAAGKFVPYSRATLKGNQGKLKKLIHKHWCGGGAAQRPRSPQARPLFLDSRGHNSLRTLGLSLAPFQAYLHAQVLSTSQQQAGSRGPSTPSATVEEQSEPFDVPTQAVLGVALTARCHALASLCCLAAAA
jgi:hypothetical protein